MLPRVLQPASLMRFLQPASFGSEWCGPRAVLSVYIVARMRWASSLLFMYLGLGPVLFNKKNIIWRKKKKTSIRVKLLLQRKEKKNLIIRITKRQKNLLHSSVMIFILIGLIPA